MFGMIFIIHVRTGRVRKVSKLSMARNNIILVCLTMFYFRFYVSRKFDLSLLNQLVEPMVDPTVEPTAEPIVEPMVEPMVD